MPKISVIVPVYNTEKYLPTCLNSILNQTEESIEVIAINDCSTDNSLKIMKQFEKIYPYKMKIIDLKENVGLSTARNIGLDLAQGDYIGFVDSDDIISLNMYENFYNLAKNHDVNIVVGSHFRFFDDEYLNKETYITQERKKAKIIEYGTKTGAIFSESPSVWDKLFKHESILDIRFSDGYIYEDVGFTYLMLLKEKEAINYLNDDYGYRITKGSIMNSRSLIKPSILDIIEIANQAYQLGEKLNLDDEALKQLQDILKISICKMTRAINTWKIRDKRKKELIEKMLSIANVTFPEILEIKTEEGKKHNDRLLNIMRNDYYIEQIPENQVEYQKENLKRKIKSLGKRQKPNR